jgi:uncharacterized integral membrane protein
MNPFSLLIKLAFFLAALWLAVNNLTPVDFRLSSNTVLSVPLIAVLLGGVLLGVVACALALAPRLFRLRRERPAMGADVAAPPLKAAAGNRAAPVFAGERLVDAARNVGAVGEIDPDVRPRR